MINTSVVRKFDSNIFFRLKEEHSHVVIAGETTLHGITDMLRELFHPTTAEEHHVGFFANIVACYCVVKKATKKIVNII